MALSNNSKSNATYIKVVDGKFRIRCEQGDDGAVSRTLESGKNKGSIIYEKLYNECSGHIKKVWIKEDENYGDQFNIKISDGSSSYVITVPVSGNHAKAFFRKMNNIDIEDEVVFSVYKLQKRVDGVLIADKFNHGWTISQNGQKLEDHLKREDIPEMEQKKVKGKVQWDDSEQIEFLLKKFDKWAAKNLPEEEESYQEEKPKQQSQKSSNQSKKKDDYEDDEDEDDIPF